VTYRASISTGTLAGQELVAALEEWPRVHRSILLQGERLSVDDTCPVIIQSLDEEECEVSSPPNLPVMVTLRIFLAAFVSALVFGVVLASLAVIIVLLGNKRRYFMR
jgi:hypothetical protein